MKTKFSRNLTLIVALVFFVCATDHVIGVLLPYLPKAVSKATGRVFKTVSELDRIVRQL